MCAKRSQTDSNELEDKSISEHKRIQTAEGWKRGMEKKLKESKEASKKKMSS